MIYLDNAATSHPKPVQVYDRMDRFAREVGANPGRSGHRMAGQAEAEIAEVRRLLTTLFGGSNPSRLVFTLNATDALNMALKGVLTHGDHVVTSLLEHNSVARPLNAMESAGMVTVTRVRPGPDGTLDPGTIDAAINDRTRLVALGQASNVLGTAQPIADIGAVVRGRDRLFLVDAAQSAGVLPIDVGQDAVDLLAFTGHKGLLGPVGTGGLYVGDRVSPRPWREGGTGGDSALDLQPAEYPNALEAGTPNTVGIAGLGEAVRVIDAHGVASMGAHERRLAVRLRDALEKDTRVSLRGPRPSEAAARTGIVSFTLAGHAPSEVGAILDASFGIAVRTGLHCAPGAHRFLGTFPEGTVRVSPGPFNTEDDIDALVAALLEILS